MSRSGMGPGGDVETLAVAASLGDSEALAELYRLHTDRVWRLAFYRLGEHAASDDVTSEVWMRVVRGIGSYRPSGAGFPAWLYRITTRQIADHWRAVGRRRERLTADMIALADAVPGDGPDDIARRTEEARELADAVNRLPDTQREVVTLRFFVGLTVPECAAVLGKSEGAVKQLQLRAVRALRVAMPTRERDATATRTVTPVAQASGSGLHGTEEVRT
jgi:RNA polymerase sigma-70 factor (ECF subfamily)